MQSSALQMLTVAILGAGKLGQVHAHHWRSVPGVTIVGIADSHPNAAASLAERFCPAGTSAAYQDLTALLKSVRPDIVDICTPTPTHRSLIAEAADAQCAVFVEKPLARTLEDCDAIVQTVRQTGIPLMVGHVVRWFPAFARAKEILDAGGVGRVVTVRTARMAGFPKRDGAGGSWYADAKQSGGVVLDALLHDFDWLLWCFGPIARVYAKGLMEHAEHVGLRDYALVTLRFQSGAVAHVTGSWAHPGAMRTTYEVCGDAGMLEFDSEKSVPLTLLQPTARLSESPMAPADDPYLCEIRAFADALRAGLPPPVSAEDGREAVRVALAALESIQTGQAVTLT